MMKKSDIYGLLVDGIMIGLNVSALIMDFGQKDFGIVFYCHIACIICFGLFAKNKVRTLTKNTEK